MRLTGFRKALVIRSVVSLLLGLTAVVGSARAMFAADTGADVDLVTRGDVEAIFNTKLTGCLAILVHTSLSPGPVTTCHDTPRARINPFIDQLHYCVDDWHLITLALLDSVANKDLVAQTTLASYIDGALLTDTQQTPVKRVDPVWAQQTSGEQLVGVATGQFMAPGVISVGSHTLRQVLVNVPLGALVDLSVTFFVDPSGTGICLVA